MKGWLLPQWNKRWRGAGAAWQSGIRAEERSIAHDEQLQTLHEGHYSTMVYFFSTLARDGWSRRFDLSKRLNELSEHELVNLKRGTMEVALIATTLALFGALKGLGDDEEDESLTQDAYYLAAYVMRRGSSEYGFYLKPTEMMNLMQDPAAVFALQEATIKLMHQSLPWNATEQYESGWREGQFKIRKDFEGMFPFMRQIGGFFHVEDSFAYYNL